MLVASLLITTLAHQQVERTSAPLPVIGNTFASLTVAKGWTKTNTDQWVSRPNKLLFREDSYNKAAVGDWGLGLENFIRFERHKVVWKGQTSTLLIRIYTDGSYKYPAIHEGWSTSPRYDWWVIGPVREVVKSPIKWNSAYVSEVPILYAGGGVWSTGEISQKDLAEIARELAGWKPLAKATIRFGLFPVKTKEGEFMRFLIGDAYENRDDQAVHGKSSIWEEDFAVTTDQFNTHYYESSVEALKDFLKDDPWLK